MIIFTKQFISYVIYFLFHLHDCFVGAVVVGPTNAPMDGVTNALVNPAVIEDTTKRK
jgi:hypothetical protein